MIRTVSEGEDIGKTGGVEGAPKKMASERAPLALLHGAQQATRLSKSCVPPTLRGIT